MGSFRFGIAALALSMVACGGEVAGEELTEPGPGIEHPAPLPFIQQPSPAPRPIDAPLDPSLALEAQGTADVTAKDDGAIHGDGQADAVFEVVLEKPVIALTLVTTDRNGNPSLGQQWDTLVDKDAIPVDADGRFDRGGWTWQLAVTTLEGKVLNDQQGRLASAGEQPLGRVRLVASNSGYFRPEVSFRLVATLTDGSSVAGPVHTYDGPALGY